ncbi:flagellar basal body P-ring formation chaperone FlgA [Apirhabdus apintestini]|nr:flagellar basal body P-ring formation chaperone FlgA [Enterobacteriaceae bacterium CA-0114]
MPLCALLLAWSGLSWGQDSLEQQIAGYLQAQHQGAGINFNVTLNKTPALQCESPSLRVAEGSKRLTGNVSVLLNCGGKMRFIQARVAATGSYWVASKPLNAGQAIAAEDIQLRSGDLAKLTPDIIFKNEDIVGYVLQHRIAANAPVIHRAIRKPRRVRNRQRVTLIAQGSGFRIHSMGEALSNGSVQDSIMVRTASGKLVKGTVGEDGAIYIAM